VSRAVQNKYALTPWGIYPLKFFFSTALPCIQSDIETTVSSHAIKKRIKEILALEDKAKPLSDASLTDILNSEGVGIKRRTVAKYRESLNIERQSQRRL